MNHGAVAPYAPVIIKLLQDVLYQEDSGHWDLLLRHQKLVQEYFEKIGIEVLIDESEGYAFLRQPADEEISGGEQPVSLPRLVRRDRLSYHVTLLCVLLREKLQQFDSSASGAARLIFHEDDIHEMMHPFYRERSDEVRLYKSIDSIIKQVVDMGFLKRLTGPEENLFEVRRILKARISADTLVEIKEKLKAYAESTDV
jgi:hypothetical protein